MNWVAMLWLILLVVFLIVEAATVTLASIWFAGGALCALAVSLLGLEVWVQVTVFLLVSAALLAALRPLAKKYLAPKVTATNIDAVIGSTGLVTAAVDNVTATGQVKLGAMEWTARSTTGEPIPTGTRVRVDRIEGVKVFVTVAEVPETV